MEVRVEPFVKEMIAFSSQILGEEALRTFVAKNGDEVRVYGKEDSQDRLGAELSLRFLPDDGPRTHVSIFPNGDVRMSTLNMDGKGPLKMENHPVVKPEELESIVKNLKKIANAAQIIE